MPSYGCQLADYVHHRKAQFPPGKQFLIGTTPDALGAPQSSGGCAKGMGPMGCQGWAGGPVQSGQVLGAAMGKGAGGGVRP